MFTKAWHEEKVDKNAVVEVKEVKKTSKKNKIIVSDSLGYENNDNEALVSDSLKGLSVKDTMFTVNPESSDIVVRKDELLSTKTLEVNNLSPVAKASAKDSLLQKVSGMKDDKNSASQFFNIEFWKSPLNYKGYKMSKYKIVLYGIAYAEGLKVYRLDDVVYLKQSSFFYRLDYGSDFRQYERITDETVINKLK